MSAERSRFSGTSAVILGCGCGGAGRGYGGPVDAAGDGGLGRSLGGEEDGRPVSEGA